MTPPTLDLKDARFNSLSNAFSTAASPMRNSFNLSCRSPITPSHSGRPTTSSSRHGSFLKAPAPYSPTSRLDISSRGDHPHDPNYDGDEEDDDDETATLQNTPTDDTWFLPHSPGLPPHPPPSADDGKLGVLSAISIVVGKTMGVGAYSVPSAIISGVGSVGMTLTLWVVGALISFCGLAVYLDLGTAIPRSGGERVYLERIFRRPYMLASCMFMSYVVLLGFSTPNAIVLGEHFLYATGTPENAWNVRLIAVLVVTMFCAVHARHPRLGLRLVDALGALKILILVAVVVAGVAGGLMGVGSDGEDRHRVDVAMDGDAPSSTAQRNFGAIWEGTSMQPYDYATALLKILYCFRGYSTANQVLGEVRNPVRTLQVAAPIALGLVSVAYLALNVAFFLVVDKDELRDAGVVVAGVFFRKVFGDGLGAHILPLCIVISAAGNIAATSFAQARVNEELAREAILPSIFLSTSKVSRKKPSPSSPPPVRYRSFSPSKPRPSSRPASRPAAHGSPSRGLLLHWLVSTAAIVIPPPGKIFNFLVDIGGYPVSVMSVAVSLGLLYLHLHPDEHWVTPCKAPRAAILIFAANNCLLLVLPWVPPRGGMAEDGRFPSFAYPATSLGVLALGAVYWCFWRRTGTSKNSGGHCHHRETPRRRKGANVKDDGCAPFMASGDDDLSDDSEGTFVEEENARRGAGHMVHVGGGSGLQSREKAVCGCRACPEVRRRAVCGCAQCPTRNVPGQQHPTRSSGGDEDSGGRPIACCSRG